MSLMFTYSSLTNMKFRVSHSGSTYACSSTSDTAWLASAADSAMSVWFWTCSTSSSTTGSFRWPKLLPLLEW